MNKELPKFLQMARQFAGKDGHRFAIVEGNRDCNRRCSYCAVPEHYDREKEPTIAETCQRIDWLYDKGFRLISLVGGESLASSPFITKEGLSFFEHTRQVVRYAHEREACVSVASNGDYVGRDMLRELAKAGLDSFTFSLHTFNKEALDGLIFKAKIAANYRIIPTIQVVLTSETANLIPGIAAYTAKNGIPFGFSVVQEKGGDFSKINETSLIPSLETQKQVFKALLQLQQFGFVRGSRGYMKHASDYFPNDWTCDPEQDTFIHIGAEGNVNICSDVRTGIHFAELNSFDNSLWRETKRVKIRNCGNCLYQCFYDSQNPDLVQSIPFLGVALLIKTGNTRLAEKWGQFAVEKSKRLKGNAKNMLL